ncbi:MAG: hypothetical protein ABIS36_13375 [Chryseolinea sp.]
MKKVLVGALLSFVSVVSFAQGKSIIIPSSVLHSFTGLYPEIKDVQWNYDEPNYEASFRLRNKTVTMFFDESGYISEVKNELQLFELPIDVSNLIGRKYSGWHIEKATHIDMNGTAYYETIVKKETESVTLVFDRTGGLMLTVMP